MEGIRHWLRRARREPGSTAATVGILATGIAANVVVFQCVERLVLDPLPLPDPDRIVVVGAEMPRAGRPLDFFEALSGPEIAEVRRDAATLTGLLPFDLNSVRAQAGELPARLFAGFVWADPLPVLGGGMALGRGFTADEVRRGDRVALLSESTWRSSFGGDPTVVGRSVTLDDVPHEVVGVLPPFTTVYGVDVWIPSTGRLEDLPRDRRNLNLLGRISPGATLDEVNRELAAVARRLERVWVREDDAYTAWRLAAQGFARSAAFAYTDEAALTLAATALVLLLVCVNLGNLALARGVARRGAVAACMALGAAPRRLRRDAALESLFLSGVGGVLAVGLSAATLAVLGRSLPGVLQPSGPPLALTGLGLAYGLGASLTAGLCLAVLSRLALASVTPREVLGGGPRTTGGRRLPVLQRWLVAAQFALGLALASGAGAVGSGVVSVLRRDPGFDADAVVSMRLSLPPDTYAGEAVSVFFLSLLEQIEGLDAVERASMATQVAPSTIFTAEIATEAQEQAADPAPRLLHTVVGNGYFQAMGIPLIQGRALDGRDRAGAPVALVVNEAAEERLFPGRRALGQRIRVRGSAFDSGWGEVVGVSRAVHNQGTGTPPAPEVFTAHAQAGDRYRQMFLVVRSQGDPGALVAPIRGEVRRLDPAQPAYAVSTPRDALGQQVAARRVAAGILAGLSAMAVVLASLGLQGVLAYVLATRRRELAVRSALGAGPARLRLQLLREVGGMAAAGIGAGLLLTLWLGWVLRAALGDAAAWRGPAVAWAAGVLVLAALAAAAVPARRVGQVDPGSALRGDS